MQLLSKKKKINISIIFLSQSVCFDVIKKINNHILCCIQEYWSYKHFFLKISFSGSLNRSPEQNELYLHPFSQNHNMVIVKFTKFWSMDI